MSADGEIHAFPRHGEPAPSMLLIDTDAELSVLGCALADNEAIHLVGQLEPRHFYDPVCARIWAAIQECATKAVKADPLTISDKLGVDPGFDDLGGRRFLLEIWDKAPPASSAASHAAIIIDRSLRRDLVRTAEETARAARLVGGSATEQLAAAEHGLSELAHHNGAPSAWKTAGQITAEAISTARTQKGLVGISTGLNDLDAAMGGLRKGQLIIIAGRPAMGKSTAALQITKAVSRKGRGVAFFSLEMPEFDLGLRLACDVAHDPRAIRYNGLSDNPTYFDAARGRLTDQQWNRLDQARDEIGDWPLLIDVRPRQSVPEMLGAARRQIRTWERRGVEPGCIVVDHLTIARPANERGGNKVAEIGDISGALAEMAKVLDLPVVALCQLSRDIEKGGRDKRPTLADLRWSGEIEQDARVVTFLYRPEYYIRPPEDQSDFEAVSEHREKLDKARHKLFWLIEKNNNGPVGQVETYCDIASSAIRDRLGER